MTRRPEPDQFDPRERRPAVLRTVAVVAGVAILIYVAVLMGWIAR